MTQTHSGGGTAPRTFLTAPAFATLLVVVGAPAAAFAASPSPQAPHAPVAAIAKAALPAIVDI